MRISTSLLVLSLVVSLPVGAADAYTVTLNGLGSTFLRTFATDLSDSAMGETVRPTALSYAYLSTTVDGTATSESDYDLSNDGFGITFDHARGATYGEYAQSNGNIRFSTDENVKFDATGNFTASDSEGRRTWFDVRLYDYTDASFVFRSIQKSDATANESFVLGGLGGDFENLLTGVLSGDLIGGHDYGFIYNVYIQAFPGAATDATAVGEVLLSLSIIPEPNTALLVSLGLIGLAAQQRRSK